MIPPIRTTTEHEARQLAARYFTMKPVHIIAGQFRGADCCFLEIASAPPHVREHEALLFEGLGGEAGPIDEPLAWSETPAWKKGLWLRRTVNLDNSSTTTVLEWDGLGVTPDVELPTPDALSVAWLGPLPPMPF